MTELKASVGQEFYIISTATNSNNLYKNTVDEIRIFANPDRDFINGNVAYLFNVHAEDDYDYFDNEDIGVTVFLTEAEAIEAIINRLQQRLSTIKAQYDK